MCGLFGFMDYKHNQTNTVLNCLCNALARESEIRGSHSTGIAYANKYCGTVDIYKQPKPASMLDLKVPGGVSAIIGHTRHATQGNVKDNYNNHPFLGHVRNNNFALAHNGVIYNDHQLRREYKLPDTQIETDSYIGVQLLEMKNEFSLQSHKFMAEQIIGSYTFTTINQYNTLYITKGSSPISIIHFRDIGLYIYASTEKILWNAIMSTPLFEHIKKRLITGKRKCVEFIDLREGEILKITSNGAANRCTFKVREYETAYDWHNYRSHYCQQIQDNLESEYLTDIVQAAASMSISADDILLLHEMGYTHMELEELIYDPDMLETYISELKYELSLPSSSEESE